jgi:hypothetical protein
MIQDITDILVAHMMDVKEINQNMAHQQKMVGFVHGKYKQEYR